jgi:hypothetical protein
MKHFLAVALLAPLLAGCSTSADKSAVATHPPSSTRPCTPCTVSAQVGPLLKEAQTLAQAEDWKGAMDKVNAAEAVKTFPDDENVISQLRQYIAVKSSQSPQPN